MGKRNPSKTRKENSFDQAALDQSDSCGSQETGSNWVSTSIKSTYNTPKKGMVIAGIVVLVPSRMAVGSLLISTILTYFGICITHRCI